MYMLILYAQKCQICLYMHQKYAKSVYILVGNLNFMRWIYIILGNNILVARKKYAVINIWVLYL